MKDVYLSLGSNMGDRRAYLEAALSALSALPHTQLAGVSPLYETAAWGKTDQADFLNLCAHVRTDLNPQDFLQRTQAIELSLDRERLEHWGPRTIDIDILLFGDLLLETPQLTVPHPYMTERAFVLVPLADLAAVVRHPATGQTIADLARQMDRETVVRVTAEADWQLSR